DEMVGMAARIAEELGMEVVVNRLVHTAQVVDAAREARSLGADIIVARGRQASIIKEATDLPVAEIRLTGQEVALLLHRARLLVAQIPRPKIGVVTMPNMIGDIRHFDEVLGIEVHTYFVSGLDEMGPGAQRAIDDGMDIILGGDFVNEYCRRQGQLTLFFDSTEDSLRTGLRSARSAGFAADAERKNTARLQALLDYSFNGILELDGGGTILQANDMACKILGLEKSALVGVPLFSLMPVEDADLLGETLRTGHEMYFSVLTVAEVNIIANAAPVGTAEGVVFSFYEMRKMERQGARALRERYRLHRYLAHGRFEDVNHTGAEMQHTVKLARAFAETMQPILLQGEVGSGKSLFAQSIHNSSPCSSGPFVSFPCSAGWENQG
ncbi:MAG: PrpR N-terminal domain-containing protein, partial [Oscillospiraceae bacterium]